jgi:uncharacterized protein involved in exopolysaccharide biosynthesis
VNDIQHTSVASVDSDELDVIGFIRLLWRHKVLMASTCLVFGLIAVVIALLTTPIYRGEVVVTEVRDHEMGSSGGIASELGGLASLAGMDLASVTGVGQSEFAILNSNHLVEEFVKRNNLLPVLLKHSKKPPTLWLAVKKFKDGVVVVHKDVRKGVITVDCEWTDAATAAGWANSFVALANELIRRRALDDAGRNIAYLTEQLTRTNDVELRKVIYNLIESQTKTLMLANGRTEYAFQVVDEAIPPEIRTRPHRTLMVLVGLAMGLTLGMAAALILDRFERVRRRELMAAGVGLSGSSPRSGGRAPAVGMLND